MLRVLLRLRVWNVCFISCRVVLQLYIGKHCTTELRHRLAQSFVKGGFHALSAVSNPNVAKLIVADYRDLVSGVYQSLDLPEATSPTPRNDVCSA